MPTPLYDCLKSYAESGPARFHMPGHKGHTMPVPELAAVAPIDLTEITPTGNLFEAGEPFDSAQQLWADLMGFDCCQFLTNGSTGGIHTGLPLKREKRPLEEAVAGNLALSAPPELCPERAAFFDAYAQQSFQQVRHSFLRPTLGKPGKKPGKFNLKSLFQRKKDH